MSITSWVKTFQCLRIKFKPLGPAKEAMDNVVAAFPQITRHYLQFPEQPGDGVLLHLEWVLPFFSASPILTPFNLGSYTFERPSPIFRNTYVLPNSTICAPKMFEQNINLSPCLNIFLPKKLWSFRQRLMSYSFLCSYCLGWA